MRCRSGGTQETVASVIRAKIPRGRRIQRKSSPQMNDRTQYCLFYKPQVTKTNDQKTLYERNQNPGPSQGPLCALRHRNVGTIQLLWNAGHPGTIHDQGPALRQSIRLQSLRQLHIPGISHPADRRIHFRQVLGQQTVHHSRRPGHGHRRDTAVLLRHIL